MENLIAEIIKFSIPAIVVFLTSFFLLKAYLNNDYKKRDLEFREKSQSVILPLRLQAYERMSLFLERISPNNLIHRVRKADMNAHDLHISLLNSIRLEYEHNLSQQIYINIETWEMIKSVKEEVITLINSAAKVIPPDAAGSDLSKSIYEILIKTEQALPTQKALNHLKMEVMKIY